MKREVKIGIFAIVVLVGTWAGIRFLKGLDIFSRNNTYYAVYEQTSGLQPAAPIFIKGVKVGTVTGIDFNDDSGKVDVALGISRKYFIPQDSKAEIFSNGLMGNKAVEISLGQSPQPLEKYDTIRTEDIRDLMELAGSEFDFFKQRIATLVDDITATLERVDMLIDDNAADIHGTLAHLDSAAGALDEVLVSEKQGLKQTIEGLASLGAALDSNAQRLDSVIVNVDAIASQFARADLAAKLESAVSKLDTALGAINDGTGSAGKLINNPELYDSLNEASANLSALLEDLKANPKRYVHFSLFGRSDKKDKKESAAKTETDTKRD